jgi:hypothetical protein
LDTALKKLIARGALTQAHIDDLKIRRDTELEKWQSGRSQNDVLLSQLETKLRNLETSLEMKWDKKTYDSLQPLWVILYISATGRGALNEDEYLQVANQLDLPRKAQQVIAEVKKEFEKVLAAEKGT